jgi:uncharacterized membrane protein YhaH (DUF805 family)
MEIVLISTTKGKVGRSQFYLAILFLWVFSIGSCLYPTYFFKYASLKKPMILKKWIDTGKIVISYEKELECV